MPGHPRWFSFRVESACQINMSKNIENYKDAVKTAIKNEKMHNTLTQ